MKRLALHILLLAMTAALAGCGARTAEPATDDDDDDGGGDQQPVVSAAASVLSGSAPLEVQFTGVAAGGDGTLQYFWDFGDGESAQAQSPIHTFVNAGVFSAVFTATDADGDFAAATVVVTVGNASIPVVSIVATPTTGTAPLNVSFTANTAGGNAPLSFSWEFGDGGVASAASSAHTYVSDGTYLARVEVQDADGDVAEASITIVVGAPQNNNKPDLKIFNVGAYETGLEDGYEPNDTRATAYYLGDYGTNGMTYTVSTAYIDPVELTYYVDVVNNGAAANAPFYVDFHKNRATAPAASDLGDLYATVSSLGSQTAKRLYFTVQNPAANAKAYAFADTLDQIDETNETNNASQPTTIDVTPDVDWFSVYETAGYTLTITLDQLPADYDVELYDAGNNRLASSAAAGTSAESISYPVTTSGYYFVKIYGYNGATSSTTPYRLVVNVP